MKKYPLTYKTKLGYVRNKRIQEYDMESGGYSLTISEKLIEDEELLEKLSLSNKQERQVLLGLYAKEDKHFVKALNNAFKKYVNGFIHLNNIEEDHLLFIKKDSITFYNSEISRTSFKKVNFTKRGEFTSFLRLGNLEFYYNGMTNEKLLKGIDIQDHTNTLVEEIFKIIHIAEFSSKKNVENHLKELRQAYVNRELEDSYYRELSVHTRFSLTDNLDGFKVYSDIPLGMDDDFFEETDITYNYMNILLPLFKTFV